MEDYRKMASMVSSWLLPEELPLVGTATRGTLTTKKQEYNEELGGFF
jgi:hypothetical protein